MLNAFKKLFCISFLCFFVLPSFATTIDKLVVFGDSLSDNGNMFNLTSGKIPRNPPYFSGHFSNGMVWVEYVANALHFDTSNKAEFSDYAYAKAWGSDLNDIDPLSFFTLSSEIDEYIRYESKHGAAEANHLFTIWIGNNDYLGGDKTLSVDMATSLTVNAIKANMETLINDGARHFLVLNLTDLGVTPSSIAQGPVAAGRYSMLSFTHNAKLSLMLDEIRNSHSDVDVIEIDLMTYFEKMVKSPAEFKLKVVDKACYDGDFGNLGETDKQASLSAHAKIPLKAAYYAAAAKSEWHVCNNPDEYVYWDSLHPTGAVHKILAEYVVKALKQGDVHK